MRYERSKYSPPERKRIDNDGTYVEKRKFAAQRYA